MNWDREIEVEGNEGIKATVTVGELQSVLMGKLTKDELEEFAGKLIKWGELSPTPSSLWSEEP